MVLKSCCCGCALTEGAKGVAIYNLIREFCVLLWCVSLLPNYVRLSYESFDPQYTVYRLSSLVGISILLSVFSVLLVKGIEKNKPIYILPFLILDGILIAIGGALMIYEFYHISNDQHYREVELDIGNLVGSIFIFLLEIYLYIVIISTRGQLPGPGETPEAEDPANSNTVTSQPTTSSTKY